MLYLEEQGFRITWLPVDRYGRVSLSDLEAAVCEDTILASVMYVNNEVGALEPVEEIGRFLKEKLREYFLRGCVQAMESTDSSEKDGN